MCTLVFGTVHVQRVVIIVTDSRKPYIPSARHRSPVWVSSAVKTPKVNFMLTVVKHWAKHFICIISLNLNNVWSRTYHYSNYVNDEIEAQMH